MYRINIYLETSSWYLGVRERWGGYVITYIRKNGELASVEGFEQVKGTYNHVLLHMLNLAMERVTKQSEIHICSANSFILDMIDNNLASWAENEFMTQKGKPIKDQEEWRKLWEQIKKNNHTIITERGLHEFSHWMMAEFLKRGGQPVDNSEKPQKDKSGKGGEENGVKKEKET